MANKRRDSDRLDENVWKLRNIKQKSHTCISDRQLAMHSEMAHPKKLLQSLAAALETARVGDTLQHRQVNDILALQPPLHSALGMEDNQHPVPLSDPSNTQAKGDARLAD